MKASFAVALSIFALLSGQFASAYDFDSLFLNFESNKSQQKTEELNKFISKLEILDQENLSEFQKTQLKSVKAFLSARKKMLKSLEDVKKYSEADVDSVSKSGLAVCLNNIAHSIAEVPSLQEAQIDAVKTLLANDIEQIKSIKEDYVEIIKALLKAKGNSDEIEKAKKHAMVIAIKKGHIDIVKLLLNSGLSLNKANEKGITLLMVAAKHSEAIMPLLIKAGADINAQDKGGYYVLNYALKGGDHVQKNVQLLKKLGAKEKKYEAKSFQKK